MDQPIKNHGVRVTLAGLGINLALGILYTWSVIKAGIPENWQWSDFEKTLPYSTAVLVFSLMMVPAGRLQDRLGPRLVATIGGLLVGLGMMLASMAESSSLFSLTEWISTHLAPGVKPTVIVYFIGFGLLAGTGIGFGYASATPPAVKWFPPARTGLIAGLVVSGFGLASVYASPLTKTLIRLYGLQNAVLILGVAFLLIVMGLSQLLVPPPKGYVPAGGGAKPNKGPAATAKREDFRPTEMLATGQFYLCWFLYAIGAGAGLMIISQLATTVAKQANLLESGFWLVVSCGVGNRRRPDTCRYAFGQAGEAADLAGLLLAPGCRVWAVVGSAARYACRQPACDAPSVGLCGGELWRQPGGIPFDRQGLLRAEELWGELRVAVHRMGIRGIPACPSRQQGI